MSAEPPPTLATGEDALMPAEYYTLAVPPLVRTEARLLSPARRAELDRFAAACRSQPEFAGMVQQPVRSPAAARPRAGRRRGR